MSRKRGFLANSGALGMVFFLFLIPFAKAQQREPNPYETGKWALSVAPQYVFTNALRLDTEYEFRPARSRLMASLYIYNGEVQMYHRHTWFAVFDGPGDEIRRIGLDLMHKHIIHRSNSFLATYWGYGIGYHAVGVTFEDGRTWVDDVQDGLPIIRLRPKHNTDRIRRFDAFVGIGNRVIAQNTFLIDIFFGLVHKQATISREGVSYRDYASPALMAHGYSGWLLRFNFSLGIKIK